MVQYRKAASQDAKSIRDLIWLVRINPLDLDWRRFLIAVDENNRVIGCGQVKPHRDGSRELASIAVRPEWQGQGIGKAIVDRLLEENEPPLYLTCRSVMEPYYQKFGFVCVEPLDMPPYFKKLYRFANFFTRVTPHASSMRIMVRGA